MPVNPSLLLLLLSLASRCIAQSPSFQKIPSSAPAPGTFSNGGAVLIGEPDVTVDTVPDIYGPRDIDLPFYRLYHGNMNFFPAGQLNTPTVNTDVFGSENDNANQTACGIPDNAYYNSKVAIHPYFLKYADLSRYCMQDVCISFWKEDGSSDMMLKVADICSTDPNDPTHCATPSDIKIDRSKAKVMEGLNDDPNNPGLQADQFPEKIWWYFMKCWDDGLAQPAYLGNNWFTTPALPNNLNASMSNAQQQWQNNQKSYPAKGWQTYPNGGYNTERDDVISPPITDWVKGEEPSWTPVAGGKGWGIPNGNGSAVGTSSTTSPSTSSLSNSTLTSLPSTFSTSFVSPSSETSISTVETQSLASTTAADTTAAAVTTLGANVQVTMTVTSTVTACSCSMQGSATIARSSSFANSTA